MEADLGYAVERFYSALSWAKFFGQEGRTFEFDQNSLRKTCNEKIDEANSRINYVDLVTSLPLTDTNKEISNAAYDRNQGFYDLCIFKASKAKAEADVIISGLGLKQDKVQIVLENKLNLVKQLILRQQQKENFPILGYSYYEYAQSLRTSDPYSSLIYAEYALELSNLDIYFEEKKSTYQLRLDWKLAYYFFIGVLTGILIVLFILRDKIRKLRNELERVTKRRVKRRRKK